MKNQKPTIELRKWENVRGHKLQGNHLNNAEKWSKNCSWIFCIWILLACFILLLGFMSYGWSGELMTGLSERLDTMGKKDNMVVCSLVMLVNLCPSFWSILVNYAPPLWCNWVYICSYLSIWAQKGSFFLYMGLPAYSAPSGSVCWFGSMSLFRTK